MTKNKTLDARRLTQTDTAALLGMARSTLAASDAPRRSDGLYEFARVWKWAVCLGPYRSEGARDDILRDLIYHRAIPDSTEIESDDTTSDGGD